MGIKRKGQRSREPSDAKEKKEKAATNIVTAGLMYQAAVTLKKEFDKGLGGTTKERSRVAAPFITETILAAFGIENALKALIRREGENPGNIHNLRKLYDKLKPETQQRISEKSAAIDIRVNGKLRRIRVEGVIDEHQESFEEWRYRESGKGLPVIPGLLANTLHAIIETHKEKYGEEVKREERQRTGQVSPDPLLEMGMVQKYYESVFY